MKTLFRVVLLLTALALAGSTAAAAAAEHKYVGTEKCKICHKIQHTSWSVGKHAKAFQSLKPEEQKDRKCFTCHVTNGNAAMPGVQCEQCHGPGSDYMGVKVMQNRAAAVAAGLKIPTKEDCVQCHNAKSPNFKGFDFDTAVKAVHKHKPKPKA